MNLTTLSAAARRFPLVGRPRPTCPSLPERVTEVAGIARHCEGMHEAAHALNKAALLASDCGLPGLARDLCWQHINVYRAATTPLTVVQARYMLEPVINLARLQIRADNGSQALRLLEAVHRAVTANTTLLVEGRTLPLTGLIGTRQEHHKLREWVWLLYLEDGIRALTLAGRWDEAAAHAETHRGVGLHLMDGRQAVIIAHCLRGEQHAAHAALQESTPAYPWEQQVASCLAVMCAHDASPARDITTMVDRFLEQEPRQGYEVFRARLGLTVATLAGDTDPLATARVFAQVATETIEAGDGYAAREVIKHRGTTELPPTQREALAGLVTSSALGSGALPESVLTSLISSVEAAKKALAMNLGGPC
ncbi:hypothetical protein [Streptosporangium sandarakinum]|uniref:hypothetical protein n=1 Tax=Streptosporangium sandarakinum TaxID=1260955 RepID=UPI0036B5234A